MFTKQFDLLFFFKWNKTLYNFHNSCLSFLLTFALDSREVFPPKQAQNFACKTNQHHRYATVTGACWQSNPSFPDVTGHMSITPAWQRGHTHPHTVPVIGACCLGPLLATKGMSDTHCKLYSLSYKCAKYTGDGTCTFTYFKNIYCQNFKMWLTYTVRYSVVLCNMKPDWKKCFKSVRF